MNGPSPAPRTILHVDMDAFFASVEQLDHPELRGRPVLVGGDGPRGVVSAASYEARTFGCRSAMPMARAKRLCPDAIAVPGRMARYVEMSRAVFAVFEQFSPRVEPLSIDEAFLDLTGTGRLLGAAPAAARRIKDAVRAATGLTASIGVAPNKYLAKIASDLEKPDGLVVVPADAAAFLAPLPVERIWGVGPKTAERLHRLGLRTIGDLQARPRDDLERRFGDAGAHWWRLAHGIDARPVVPDRGAKSIGHESTFDTDLEEPDEVRAVLRRHVEDVARRLRRAGVRARGVQVKIRFGDFETVTRQATLDAPTDRTDLLHAAALELFDRWARGFRPVRLIGMSAQRLEDAAVPTGLFPDPEDERRRGLDRAADAVRERYGKEALRRGGPGRGRSRSSSPGTGRPVDE